MNNFYTLIYLNKELNQILQDGIFSFAISPHKDVLECYVKTPLKTGRLIFSSNPFETVLFFDKYRSPKKRNVIEFFNPLINQKIISVTLAEQDRLIYIYFENKIYLLFKLFGSNPNVYLVNDEKILDAFKNPSEVRGGNPPEPHAPIFSDKISSKAKAKNQITTLNPLLPRNLLPYMIEQYQVDRMNKEEVKGFTRNITEVLLKDPRPRVLTTGEVCLWGEEWLSLPTERSFDAVNETIRYVYREAVHLRRLHNRKEGILRLLERETKKKESQLEQLYQADKSLDRAKEYEKFGHLLMANAHRDVNAGTVMLEVEDFYEGSKSLQIPLKKSFTVAENAEYYYKKAKASRTSYKQAQSRIPALEKETELTRNLLAKLREIAHLPKLEKWLKDNYEVLQRLGYGVEDDSQATSPFRKLKVGKYEIWIGKNAKSNDKLTSIAHKEDIWLHARGVGGSHVIVRMGNQKEFPPKEIILRAAGYAAYYSKAKGMTTAPVMYTKRKYVRKPKGADPGTVVVEREEVEMVPPTKPQKK